MTKLSGEISFPFQDAKTSDRLRTDFGRSRLGRAVGGARMGGFGCPVSRIEGGSEVSGGMRYRGEAHEIGKM